MTNLWDEAMTEPLPESTDLGVGSRVTVYFPGGWKPRIKTEAENRGVSVSHFILRAVQELISREASKREG